MDPKVSIIIPAYFPDQEVWQIWLEAEKALYFSLGIEYDSDKRSREADVQLIVVENGSLRIFDHRQDDPSEHSFMVPGIVIHKPFSIGYARAANIGLALADGYYLVVMNVDVVVPPDWLEILIAEYDCHIGLKGGIISPDDKGRRGVWRESWFGLFCTTRDTISRVGYFSESLPYRFHDQDFAIRVEQAGGKVLRTGAVQVRHYESSTYKKMQLGGAEALERQEMIRRYGAEHFRDRESWK